MNCEPAPLVSLKESFENVVCKILIILRPPLILNAIMKMQYFCTDGYKQTIYVGNNKGWDYWDNFVHGPLIRYAKLQVAHTPRMLGAFSPQPWVSDPDMHHGTCVTHVPWRMPGSLACGFLWSRWLGKRSRHSLRMRNSQFYVSGKRSVLIVSRRPASRMRAKQFSKMRHLVMSFLLHTVILNNIYIANHTKTF